MGSSTFQYPTLVSRTLDPKGKALRTIVAIHDHEITDADLNLMQDLQDNKRAAMVADMVSSGSLTYAPMQFNTINPCVFTIPGFDVMFNGQVVHITGNASADITMNRVQIPQPPFWAPGTQEEDARIYIVFLELWYQSLNPITGQGYYQDPTTKLFYYYPYGCVNPNTANFEIYPDDSTDPFQGLFTTERAQIQWRLNVQRVGLNYNFSQYAWGLTPDTTDTPAYSNIYNAVYAQAQPGSLQPTPGVSPLQGLLPYQYTWMGGSSTISNWNSTATYVDGNIVLYNGVYYVAYLNVPAGITPPNPAYWNVFPINGDTGLWCAGDGNVNNSLGTMDGYSYAMPVAVVFQRNYGNFNVSTNLFGCANPNVSVANNGLIASGVSGRYDSELADQVYPADVVDTRSIVQLTGTPDYDDLMRFGFGDLVTGHTTLAISRGNPKGSKAEALGSTLEYNVSIAPPTTSVATSLVNTDLVGQWDGFSNGFSSDQRTFQTTFAISTTQKTTGVIGGPWVLNDSFTVQLPTASPATITGIDVVALVSNTVTGTKTPAALLQGQFALTGLNTTSATVQFIVNLTGTAFDPGSNNLYVTVSVTYPAGSATNLQEIPFAVDGGSLNDQAAAAIFPVYGVSEYDAQDQQVSLPPSNQTLVSSGVTVNGVYAINPEYSDILIGTKVQLAVPGSLGVQTTVSGTTITTFILPMNGIEGTLNGLYCTHAFDSVTQDLYTISGRTMGTTSGANTQTVITIQAAVPPTSTVIMSFVAQGTAQLAFNAPVKGVTAIEETVLIGNFSTTYGVSGDSNYPMDGRVNVESVTTVTTANGPVSTIVLGSNGCEITGISGDNVNGIIWLASQAAGQPWLFTAVTFPASAINFIQGTVTITVSGVTLAGANAQPFFFVGSINPAFTSASSLIVSLQYIPYQGEGVLNRNYEIIHTEDTALLTTNGTGAAPVIGLADVYPYNRQLPIITMLPAQASWLDSGLTNTPIASLFDSNYVAMQQNNVEDTFDVPLHTNDFIPPLNKDTRKTVAFTAVATGGRGFATAIPHLGYAITAPTPRTVLGQNLQTTIAPITLYVDNSVGNDANSGLSLQTAKKTIGAALAELPPVLTFPCTIFINDTGVPFLIEQLQSSMEVVALGDGDIRSAKIYALGNLSRVIQEEGRLVISVVQGATNPVVIDATGFAGFGDGPTCAFYIDTSRVILNGLTFQNFQNPAIVAYNADVDMVACNFNGNAQAGSYVGCDSVIFDGGSLSVPDNCAGQVAVQTNVTISNVSLTASGPSSPPVPGAFFTGTRQSTLNFQLHLPANETGFGGSPAPVTAEVQLNSSIAVTTTFQSNGAAILQANSVLSQTTSLIPFLGGVTTDASSSIVTQVG
jgi:hypothetical protein